MKTRLFLLAALALVVFAAPALAFDQEDYPRWEIGPRFAYHNFSGDDFTLFGNNISVDMETSPGAGIDLAFFPTDYLSFQASFDFVQADVLFTQSNFSAKMGTLRHMPLVFSIKVHPKVSKTIGSYLLIGAGYCFNDFDNNVLFVEAIYGPAARISVSDEPEFHVGAGLDFYINKELALNLDVRYAWIKTEGSVNKPGFVDETFDFRDFITGIGLKYRF